MIGVAEIVNYLSGHPFCCVIVIAPGLFIPIYRWLKRLLEKS